MTTRSQFAALVLTQLGTEVRPANVCALVSQMAAENCGAAYNPCATTLPGYGSTDEWNTAGVRNYPTLQAGVEATAATLTNGDYPALVTAIKSGTAAQICQAWSASPWGTEAFGAVNPTDAAIYNVEVGTGEAGDTASQEAPIVSASPPDTASPAPAGPNLTGEPTIAQGTSGWDVCVLQRLINASSGTGLTIDGQFGALTAAAVRSFQTVRGLIVDGVVGSQTWAALLT